ncbi:serine hydrolase [Pilimelia anulata]|uniref:Serine hydrolase n=1 Tax=Pilimelia anulata TaxID=53371 RepID=A0A8J3FBR0_9ACTN|nr:serine hydrolase [Pilimelia anulata]GGJ86224.1 serine hydrolase [Pilimelia anulata]
MKRTRMPLAATVAALLASTVALAACDADAEPDAGADGPAAEAPAGLTEAGPPTCDTIWQRRGASFYDRAEPMVDSHDDRAEWTVAPPAAAGLDTAALAAGGDALAEHRGMRAVVVLRGGKLVYERYFRDGAANQSNNVHSASKSILQALTGIAVADGKIKSLDAPISTYLPQYAAAGTPTGAITVRRLLGMSSGLDWREDETEERIEESDDWVGAILGLAENPAAGFNYSTGNTHVLSAVLQAATGTTTCAYAREKLFTPLGIMPERWTRDPQGVYAGGYNMYLTARELARFGQLYLAGGVWQGKRVVPAATVTQSRTITAERVRQPGYRYASGWWATDAAGHAVNLAWGFGGQYVAVIPDLDLVVTTTQNTQGDGDRAEYRELDIRDFLTRYVVPAVR